MTTRKERRLRLLLSAVLWSMVLYAVGISALKNYSCRRSLLTNSLSAASSFIGGVTAFSTASPPNIFFRTRNIIMQRMITRSDAASKKRCASPDPLFLDNDASVVLPAVNTSSSSTGAAATTPAKKPKSRRKNKPNLQAVGAAVVTPLPDAAGSRMISSVAASATTASNLDLGSCIDLTKLITSQDDTDGNAGFQDLQIPPEELRPSAVVTVGQSFHWRALGQPKQTSSSNADDDDDDNNKSSSSAWGTHNATQWLGILRRRRRRQLQTTTSSPASKSKVKKEEVDDCDVDDDSSFESLVVILRETPTTTLYRVQYPTQNDIDARSFLLEYFRLQDASSTATSTAATATSTTSSSSSSSSCLKDLYTEWSNACPRLRAIAPVIPGVRIIQQDPFECLISFICSTNNNIPRITKMLTAIRHAYGTPLVRVKIIVDNGEEEQEEEETLYSFPSLQQLLDHATEQELRNLGFGYRAPYIIKTILQLHELGGEDYLHQLRAIPNASEVQEALTQFTGVGRKVADCVALFSLQQDDAIPVDVHVWKIARRDYNDQDSDHQLTGVKSLTPTVYRHVGDLFRSRFPNKSGWAHSLLFVAELPSFRPVLPQHIVDEMDKFRNEQQQLAKQVKQEKKEISATATTTTKQAGNK